MAKWANQSWRVKFQPPNCSLGQINTSLDHSNGTYRAIISSRAPVEHAAYTSQVAVLQPWLCKHSEVWQVQRRFFVENSVDLDFFFFTGHMHEKLDIKYIFDPRRKLALCSVTVPSAWCVWDTGDHKSHAPTFWEKPQTKKDQLPKSTCAWGNLCSVHKVNMDELTPAVKLNGKKGD